MGTERHGTAHLPSALTPRWTHPHRNMQHITPRAPRRSAANWREAATTGLALSMVRAVSRRLCGDRSRCKRDLRGHRFDDFEDSGRPLKACGPPV